VSGPPPPLHMMPHNPYSQGQPVPNSAPASSPRFDVPTAPNNLNLLSILNGTQSVAASARGSNTTVLPRVPNGVMGR
jgi:hypothetical protein